MDSPYLQSQLQQDCVVGVGGLSFTGVCVCERVHP